MLCEDLGEDGDFTVKMLRKAADIAMQADSRLYSDSASS
jgi:hypothetical protein